MSNFLPLKHELLTAPEMLARSSQFLESLRRRRSVRDFSDQPVPFEIVRNIVLAAASAPSGANKQPWTFVIVHDAETKRRIREAAEAAEREFYEHRITDEWRADLNQFGTDWHKPFLETAPYLIVLFKKTFDEESSPPERKMNYYVNESVGIAAGFLIAAIHQAGLVTLTHTPSPMGFLARVLNRPHNERPFLLLPVGYPAADARVPVLRKKQFHEIAVVVGTPTADPGMSSQ